MLKLKLLAGSVVAALSGVGLALVAHAQSLPTVGTTDVAEAAGPLWTTLLNIVKYVFETFGPIALVIGAIVVVCFAAYKHFRGGVHA
jgi:uncharacterized membrane protein YphA (DoxX/SURF4 family)